MKLLQECLARAGVGGFYRRTEGIGLDLSERLTGPYLTKREANPWGNVSLPFPLRVSVEFHMGTLPEAVAPDPVETEKIY